MKHNYELHYLNQELKDINFDIKNIELEVDLGLVDIRYLKELYKTRNLIESKIEAIHLYQSMMRYA